MDDLTRAELDQLLAVFRDQTLQIVEEMSLDLLALESGRADEEAMARLRRGAHTIKGDSACVDLNGVTTVAHKIEDVFDAVLSGKIKFDRRSVDEVLKALDVVRAAIGSTAVVDIPANEVFEVKQGLREIQNQQPEDLPQDLPRDLIVPLSAEPSAERTESIEAANRGGEAAGQVSRGFVRVEAAKIDTLLNLAG